MVTMRAATSEDEDALSALHAASIRAFGPHGYDAEQVEAWASSFAPETFPIDEELDHFVVAEKEGKIAGFGSLHRSDGEILAMYVHPDFARAGVGGALLEHLEGVARDDGMAAVTLLGSKNAVSFYEQHGYERVERTEHETGGAVLECVRMRKVLG